MALERTYIVPLWRQWLRVPKYRRAKKAGKALKEFLSKNMKQPDIGMIKIGKNLNEAVWARGIKSPPRNIKINVVKEDDGTVKAELFGVKYIVKKKIEKKDEGIAGKLKESLGMGKEKEVEAEVTEEKKETKHEKKEEKPAKKEEPKHKPAEKKPAKKK